MARDSGYYQLRCKFAVLGSESRHSLNPREQCSLNSQDYRLCRTRMLKGQVVYSVAIMNAL
jgi:hypothetical protein